MSERREDLENMSERELLYRIIDKQLEQDATLTVLSNGLHAMAMDRGFPEIAASIDRDREARTNGAHGPGDRDETTNPG